MPESHVPQGTYVRFEGSDQPLTAEQMPLPPLSAGQVLVRVTCTTICGSDLHTFSGRRQEPVPTVPGHEYVGTVVAVAAGVTDITGTPLRPADRITWSVMAACGQCDRCAADRPQKCRQLFKYGHANLIEHPFSGGFATHCVLRSGTTIVRVPGCVPDVVAAPASCATATVAAIMRHIPQPAGKRFLVLGAGLLGLTATAMADAAGAAEVHLCDPDESRRQLGTRFGAARLLSTPDEGEYDAIVEVSGHPHAVRAAFDAVAIGGDIVLAGSVFPAGKIELDPEVLVRRLASIHGVHNYHPRDLATAVAFLTEHHQRYPFAQLIHPPFELSDINAAVEVAQQKRPVRVALSPTATSSVVAEIIDLFSRHGDSEYGGEPVTQLQHALQCADLARQESASSELISAALLHDIGHLLHDLPDDAPEAGIDDVHEELGSRFLQRRFGPAVCEPVRLHVDAKRYLCATDTSYAGQLSDASLLSLKLQGGPMSPREVQDFESGDFCEDAVRLRKWDDIAKVTDLPTSDLNDFIPHLEAAVWNCP